MALRSVALLFVLQFVASAALQFTGTEDGGHPEVPAELGDIGLKIFGSAEKLKAFADGSAIKDVTLSGIPMKLVTAAVEECPTCGAKGLEKEHKANNGDVYGIRDIEAKEGLIVDVGGNIGDTAILAAKMHPNMQVLVFEPVPPTYFYMLWNLHLNGVPTLSEEDLGKPGKSGVLALNKVIGDGRNITVDWPVKHNSQGSLNSDQVAGDVKPGWARATGIQSVKFPEFLASHGVTSIRLFKMDCEGCEFFLTNLLADMLTDKHKIEHVSIEVHKEHMTAQAESEFNKVMETRGCGAAKKEGSVETGAGAGHVLHC